VGLVLPAVTLALPLGAMIAQVLLTALDRAWREQFVTTFRAAGLARTRLLVTHALRVAGLSLLSIAGVLTGNLLSGTVVVETVFTRNGLGRLAESAVSNQDIPLVQGIVVFSALVFVTVNLVTDLLYPLADPRTRPARSQRRSAPSHPQAPAAPVEAPA
jgi:peptide/nickel transport system permease protein